MFISYKKHHEELQREADWWDDRLKEISDLENRRFVTLNSMYNDLMNQNTSLVKMIDALINKYGDKFMEKNIGRESASCKE